MNSYHNFRGASGGMSCTLLYCFAYVRPRSDCNSGSKGFKAWKLLSKFLRSQIFQKINLCSCSDLAGPASLLYPTQIFEILTISHPCHRLHRSQHLRPGSGKHLLVLCKAAEAPKTTYFAASAAGVWRLHLESAELLATTPLSNGPCDSRWCA